MTHLELMALAVIRSLKLPEEVKSILDEVVFFKEGDKGLGITKHKLKVMGAPYDAKREMFSGLDTDALVGAAQFFIHIIPSSPPNPKYPVKVGNYEYANRVSEPTEPFIETLEDQRNPVDADEVTL